MALRHGTQILREFLDRIQQEVGFGGAQASCRGKWAENTDGAHAGAAGHLDIFSCIANVHAMLWIAAEPFERQLQRGGMRFALRGVFAANTCGKILDEPKFAKLAANARTVSAGDDAEMEFLGEYADDAARAGEQRRVFQFVGASPEAVGIEPFGTRKLSGAINAEPIRGIVQRELALRPIDAQSMKHREIGAEVSFVGIQERAVPIEEDRADGKLCVFHSEGIVSDLREQEK